MDVIAGNIANVETTRTPEGGPFKRQLLVFASKTDLTMQKFPFLPMKLKTQMESPGDGVKVLEISKDPSAPRLKYDPSHPDANNEGYVAYPNIDVVKEMVDMISAGRDYEANLAVLKSTRDMVVQMIDLLKS